MPAKKTAGTVTKASTAKKVKATPSLHVSVRMYCVGTGDCFVLKFSRGKGRPFTLMIDCGSCRGKKEDFRQYVEDLKTYVENTIDLLVVTHEHNDHVNGFDKCADLFEDSNFIIKEAWFAWTEKPTGPESEAAELLKKRASMKMALSNAIAQIKSRNNHLDNALAGHPMRQELMAAQHAFVDGLNTIGMVNLVADDNDDDDPEKSNFAITGAPLPGMEKIKKILEAKKTKISYLNPGETVSVEGLDGIRFYVLGPPRSQEFIYKDGKEGSDVYKKNMALNESSLAANAFSLLGSKGPVQIEDLPFAKEYVTDAAQQKAVQSTAANNTSDFATPEEDMMAKYYWTGKYKHKRNASGQPEYEDESWRTIEDEWLMSAGTLALRLNSHINNTSLALALESVASQKVMLLPGDAEYGSWESWHLIENWKKKGKDGKHLVEDLLGRTVFYKVGHHLSYNGTALEKGIKLMPGENMAAMATLDLDRIAKGWKSTMPNKYLLQDIIQRTGGRFFIMNETGIDNKPSTVLNPLSLGKDVYEEKKLKDGDTYLYKQYSFQLE